MASADPQVPKASPLRNLSSFSFDYTVTVESLEDGDTVTVYATGAFVKPDKQDCTIQGTVGPIQFSQHLISIDKQTWNDVGTGFRRVRRAKVSDDLALCASDPGFWADYDLAPPAVFRSQPETVNGIATRHFDLTDVADDLIPGRLGVGIGFDVKTLQIWLASPGRWVAGVHVEMSAKRARDCDVFGGEPATVEAPCAASLDLQLSAVDDPTLRVVDPTAS